jgi:hypothetical protein
VSDCRTLDGCIKQEGTSFHLLAYKETNYGKHTHASMSDFRFTVAFDGSLIGFGRETKRIEEAYRW